MDPGTPKHPLTLDEIARLRPRTDVVALQALVDELPDLRGLLLALCDRDKSEARIYDAIDALNARGGEPPVDRPPPSPDPYQEWLAQPEPKPKAFAGGRDFQLDFEDPRLQKLFHRMLGFPVSDA